MELRGGWRQAGRRSARTVHLFSNTASESRGAGARRGRPGQSARHPGTWCDRHFYLGKHEVTRGQFAAFANATGHKTDAERVGKSWGRRADGSWGDIPGASWRDTVVFQQTDEHPVVYVSWNDAKAFCDWATQKTRREVRLPTEAEWEYACRAGSTTRWNHGDDEQHLGEYAWFGDNSGQATHPVGQKKPNAWGSYDMHGNVREWVADWYDAGYYASSPREDPPGPAGGNDRLLRGGVWSDGRNPCRSAARIFKHPSVRISDIGSRAAVSVTPGR